MNTLVYLLINTLFAQTWIEKNAPKLPDNAPTDMVPVYETVKYLLICFCILTLLYLAKEGSNNLGQKEYGKFVKHLIAIFIVIVGMTINLWR